MNITATTTIITTIAATTIATTQIFSSFFESIMVFLFGTTAAQYALRTEKLKAAEATLLRYATEFGNRPSDSYDMQLIDTHIPISAVPLKGLKKDDTLVIHGVRLDNKDGSAAGQYVSEYPLVMLHGYMNGALYYYRNLVGLSKHFPTVVSLDMLGWGLSSRPTFSPKLISNPAANDDSSSNKSADVTATEDIFVESLEAWRKAQGMEKMVLAGHSMGGYLSVAYCERYPERVERLILLSPVGVPEDNGKRAKVSAVSWRSLATNLFQWNVTPCSVIRNLPGSRGRGYVEQYIDKRLPVVEDIDEKKALTDYLYYNAIAKPSGEYALSRLLTPYAFAKAPTVHRIPHLKVNHISFLYGAVDWMDAGGGLQVQQAVEDEQKKATTATKKNVGVYQIPKAGHLLMIDNWLDFEKALVMAAGGKTQVGPKKLSPNAADVTNNNSVPASMASPPPRVVVS